MKRSMIRLFSVFLSVMMIISSANFIVTAEDDIGITTNNTQINEDTDGETSEPTALIEDMSLRDKFTKHYVAEDGKRYAVVFSEQVHYEDEGGAWKEVDNTLFYDETTSKYTTNNVEGAFTASFATTVTPDGELVSVTDGEYTVSWTVSFAGTGNMHMSASSMAQIANGASGISEVTTVDNMTNMGKATSSVRYNSVYGSADLRYSVAYGRVEEDIILNSASGFAGYMMTVNTGELTAVKNADGSVSFTNADGEAIFNIAAPWMQDANNSYSDAIAVEVIQRGCVAYIAYTPDAEWLNEAEYPVLIDPSFTTRTYQSNYEDAYVWEYEPDNVYYDSTKLNIGYDSDEGAENVSYINILDIPALPSTATVENIIFDMFSYYDDPRSAVNLALVEDSWTPEYISYFDRPTACYPLVSNVTATETDLGDYYQYSFNLACLQEYVNESTNYANVAEFLSSGNFYGFMLTGTGYSEICSSEYSVAAYRPTMTIEYSYTPPTGIMHNGVYSFKNVNSGKYLMAGGGNIYQYTQNNAESQAFRLTYNSSTEGWRLDSMLSTAPAVYPVTAKYEQTINSSGYTTTNAYLAQYSSEIGSWQEWLIVPVGNYYKIVMRADPNLALTAYGTAAGTSSGTSATSTGNVYVSVFTGSNSQLWTISSGGLQISSQSKVENIVYATTTEAYTVKTGESSLQFCCPVTAFGYSVAFSSADGSIATVDGNGNVTGQKIGTVTIMAKVYSVSDLSTYATYTAAVSVVLGDGVYEIYNQEVSEENYYILSTYTENEPLSSWPSQYERHTQYKINHLGNGLYSIRSMLDNSMGWAVSGSDLVLTDVGFKNSTVPDNAKWKIQTYSGVYYFVPASNQSLAVSLSNAYGGDLVLTASSNANMLQRWGINKITATGTGADISVSTNTVGIGQIFKFEATMYSYDLTFHGGYNFYWYVDDEYIAEIGETTGVITGVDLGDVTVTLKYGNNVSSAVTADTHSVEVVYLSDGDYFIKNDEVEKFLRLYDNMLITERLTEIAGFQWRITYAGIGCYYLSPQASDATQVLTLMSDGSLGFQTVSGADNQRWHVSVTENGEYKFAPMSKPSQYLRVGSANNDRTVGLSASEVDILESFGGDLVYVENETNSTRLEIERTYNLTVGANTTGDNKDKWELAMMLPTSGYELEYDPSQWDYYVTIINEYNEEESRNINDITNCYAYAINYHDGHGLSYVEWEDCYKYNCQNPGSYSSVEYDSDNAPQSSYIIPPTTFLAYVLRDFDRYSEEMNSEYSFEEIGKYETCTEGKYKVVLVFDRLSLTAGNDYHWYRQDTDGFWSHKQGKSHIARIDCSGNLIVDPQIADRGNYETFVGYYELTPWADYSETD